MNEVEVVEVYINTTKLLIEPRDGIESVESMVAEIKDVFNKYGYEHIVCRVGEVRRIPDGY